MKIMTESLSWSMWHRSSPGIRKCCYGTAGGIIWLEHRKHTEKRKQIPGKVVWDIVTKDSAYKYSSS